MQKTVFEAVKLIEALGGRLSDVKKDSSGSNVYVFELKGSEIEVNSRCIKAFIQALKSLLTN